MAFWKKSDDPWDIDPEKRKKQTTAAFWENDAPAETDPAGADSSPAEEEAPKGQSLGESIKGFFGGKKEEAPIIPEKCPWCGKDMERGYIDGGRDYSVMWRNWKPRGFLGIFQPEDAREIDLLDEGDGLWCYKTVWYCRDCGKMTLEIKNARNTDEVEEAYRKPTGYEQQLNAWGANPAAYADYQAQWSTERKEET